MTDSDHLKSVLDCMLSEYKALCFMATFPNKTVSPDDLDNYKRSILKQVDEIVKLTRQEAFEEANIADNPFIK